MRRVIGRLFEKLGVQVRLLHRPGDVGRPVGNMRWLLEDLKARGLECRAILDVGANRADWSRMAKKVFPSARCCLVEPQHEMKPHIDRFLREFPDSTHVPAGAGAEVGELTFTVMGKTLNGSSFLPSAAGSRAVGDEERVVPVTTLDEIVASGKSDLPQVVKCDVEGYELEVLKGATKVLDHADVLILETVLFRFLSDRHPLTHEVIAFMAERGWLPYDFPEFKRRPLDGAVGQVDICFVRENGLLRSDDTWGRSDSH